MKKSRAPSSPFGEFHNLASYVVKFPRKAAFASELSALEPSFQGNARFPWTFGKKLWFCLASGQIEIAE